MKILELLGISSGVTPAETPAVATTPVKKPKGFSSQDVVAIRADAPAKADKPATESLRTGMRMLDLRVANQDASKAPDIDGRYFDVTRAVKRIDEIVAKFPAIATKVDLSALPGAAKTHQGQSIFAIKLGKKNASGSKPAVVIAAQHHARELNSGFMALSAMERLASGYGSDAAITKLLDERDVYIVPHVNPDGVRTVWNEQRMWRKNRSKNADGSDGVDINRNYPFLFGSCGSSSSGSSEVFRGTAGGSEPEVRTMMALQKAVRPELYIDIHNHGNEVLGLYPPCADVTPEVRDFGKAYVERLRAPMGFDTRDPSGSGEAPHWFWSQGTLSYLIEVGTAFQPRFEETVEDEKKVWKGLSAALTTWAPAARGRVTGADGKPLEATFTLKQPIFKHGETLSSRASDGAFSLWLPKGTWDVVVSAAGHAPKTVRVAVDAYDKAVALDVKLDPAQRMALTA